MTRIVGILAALVAVAVVGVMVLGGDDEDKYTFKLDLPNALGLRSGSLVTVGGVEIGKAEVNLSDKDRVRVTATLNPGEGPIGDGAKAFVTSVNLLGQKRLELTKGDTEKPQPSGTTIPADRVTPSTDLDQLLGALDADTRTRLGVLLSEAGATVAGRQADIRQLIDGLPKTIGQTTELVDELSRDNETLGRLVEDSSRFIGTLSQRRRELVGFVDTAGQSAETVAARRAELQATLAKAPGTLRTLQTFLGKLEATTVPLGPAARDITATAPEINATLAQVAPFTEAAEPALDRATDVAPTLTRLADGATPTLRRLKPTVGRVRGLVRSVEPVSAMLDKSSDNLIAVVDNWSHAVQFRDGLSHLFRGEAGFSPNTAESLLDRITGATPARRGQQPRGEAAPRQGAAPDPAAAPTAPGGAGDAPSAQPLNNLIGQTLDTVTQTTQRLDETVKGATGGVQQTVDGLGQALPPGGKDAAPLLDYLLKP